MVFQLEWLIDAGLVLKLLNLNQKILRWGGALVLLSLVVWLFNTKHTKEIAEPSSSAKNNEVLNKIGGTDEATQPISLTDGPQLQKLTMLGRTTSLQILDRDSMLLSANTAAMLELPAEKVNQINKLLRTFTDKLYAAEIAHAHVEVYKDFGEEIVVDAFDRNELLNTLKLNVGNVTNTAIATFIYDRLSHDYELGATNTDIRASIETPDDGINRITFSRYILSEKAFSPDVQIHTLDRESMFKIGPDGKRVLKFSPSELSPTTRTVTTSLLKDKVPIRIRALFDAADQLPRKEMTGERKVQGRTYNNQGLIKN